MGGTPPQGRAARLAGTIATALVIVLSAVPAAQAIPQKQAEKRALRALGVQRGDDPVIVFKLDRTLRPGARIGQAGTDRMPGAGAAGKRRGPRGTRVDAATAVVSSRTPAVMRLRGERAFFFYADLGPFQTYQHPGRVALVGKKSGRVRLSERLMWPPLINGRLPAFMRNAKAYHDRDDWAFYRPWREAATAQAAENRGPIGLPMLDPPLVDMPLRGRTADLLAAERACSLRFSDTLGDFYDFGAVDRTRGWIGATFRRLEDLNSGFVDERYVLASGMTPMEFAEDLIAGSGCRSVLLYLAGGAWANGPSGLTVGIKPAGARRVRQQHITARQVRSLMRSHLDLKFTVIVDAPYASGFADSLSREGNALIVATPGGSRARTFSYLPEVEMPGGRLRRHPGNPHGLLEFTNRALFGLERLFACGAEIEQGAAGQAQGRSFLAWMIERAFALGAGQEFPGASRTQTQCPSAPPPVATNRRPTAEAATVTTDEDTAAAITLQASDPDGDQLTYSILAGPTHGTLTGAAASRTYTPDADFNGTDGFTYRVADGRGGTAEARVTIRVGAVNDAPVLTTSSGSASFTEDGAAVAVDPALTVDDVDDAELEGATVTIASVAAADELLFIDQSGITGSYDALTGTLTLTGAASLADYRAALRSVRYRNTGDDPPAARTIEFRAGDGDDVSPAATRDVDVTPVNDAPTLDTTDAALAYEEGDGPVAVDAGVTATDPDSAMLSGATVAITPSTFRAAEDSLGFTNQNGISGAYNAATGVLTLSGTTTVANYQTALRSVTYTNGSSNPSLGTRTVSFEVTDAGGLASNVPTRDVTIAPANDEPVITTSGGTLAYTEGDPATAVDSGLTVTDVDDTDLEGAAISVIAGFEPADVLLFSDQNGITGSYDAGTGVLTLTGTSSIANYQAALRSVEYRHAGDNPALSKTVQFTADDGVEESDPKTRTITVTRVNDAPTLDTTDAPLAYAENGGPVAADGGITVTDPDSTEIQGATVQITSNFQPAQDELAFVNQLGITGAYDDTTGTLTLSGTASVASYQAALRAVSYENGSDDPNPPARTVTFHATDAEGATSAPATRDITLGAANDQATVITTGSALLYDEGDPATAVDDGLTVADPDDANLEGARVRLSAGFEAGDELLFTNQNGIVGAYDPGTGVLTLTGTSSLANYQTALRSVQYRHTGDNPAEVKTVEFRADDGDGLGPASVRNIDVTRVDDPPTAVDDSATANEDSAAGAIDVLANDTDPDGGPRSIDSVTQPANGTVAITGGGSGLTYEPDPNYCNSQPGGSPDTFTYTLDGGSSATVSVTVTCVDDPPTAVDDSATVNEDSAANAIDVLANDTDPDGGPRSVDSVTQPANGTVAITGGGTGLTYEPDPNYCNSQPGGAPDTFTYTLNGGDEASVSVTVTCVDDGPIAVNDTATVAEDSGASAIDVLANDTDGDGGPKTISSASDPANGTVVLTGGAPGAHTGLTYQPDPNYCNDHAGGTADTFTYELNGGSTATVSVTVTCVPDAPVVDTSAGATGYTENAPATAIDPAVTVSDPDPGASTITGATIQITGGYAGAEDVLALAGSHPGISSSVSGDTLTLTGDASPAAYQAALRDVTYRNTSESPSTAARTVTFTVTDGTGSGSDTKGIAVTAVDDPPTAVNDSATVLEDAAATAIPVLTNDTDVDGGPKTISAATDPANGTVVLTGGSPGARTGLTYQPDPNYCNDPPGTTPDTFTYTINGGSSATVSMTVTCVNDAPVADDETFNGNDSAHGNTAMVVDDPSDAAPNPTHPKTTVTGDILAGDTDIDGPGPLTVTPGTFATNDGGSVTVEADGDFTFHPAASTSCTDTSDFFDYTVEDSGSPEMTDTGRVTIAIAGCVWYVSNNAAGNSGTSAAPFDTLAQAEAASAANHTVFVFDGDNTSTGLGGDGYAMNAGERLIGEHEGLVVDPDGGGVLTADTLHPANAGAHPTLTATNADVIDLDDGNEVRGLNVDPQGTGGGIAGIAGDTGGATIDDVNVVDTLGANGSQAGLELNGTTGTFNVSNFTVSNNATGVLLNNAGTMNFTPAGTITITSAGAPGLSATNTNMGTSTFDAITVTGSATGGVSITNPTNPIPGSTTFDGLSLTTTGGTGFLLSNAGTVSVPAAGTANVNATGGPAIDVTGTAGATLAFDDVDSTNSASDGVNIAGLAGGTFTANSSSAITNAATIDFDLDGGTGAITYDGTITDDVGQLVRIANTTGGTKDFNGSITDGGDDDGSGIALSANSGATIRFDGGLTLATGANPAFAATGGGTVAVTDPNAAGSAPDNTLATTTATALNIVNTAIHTNGVTFRSIASNGANSGVVLTSTGSAGGLTVTGNGGTCTSAATCTGGAIQSSTGPGMNLSGVGGGVSLSRVSVNGGGDDGIRGSAVNGFSLSNSWVSGNGNAVNESGVDFVGGMTGTGTIAGSTVTGSAENGLIVTNASGSLNLGVTGSTFSNASATVGNDGIHLDANDTAAMTASVTGSTFDNNRGDHFQFSTNTTSSGTNGVTFSSNTLTGDRGAAQGGNDLGAGITISTGGGSDTAYTVANNTITGAVFPTIGIDLGVGSTAGSTLSGTVSGNTIGNAAVAASGGAQSSGIATIANGSGTLTAAITNNTIRQNAGFAGIDILSRDGSPTLNATVTGNTVANPNTNGGNGLLLRSGAITTDAGQTCAAITGNTLAGSAATGLDDFRLRQRFLTTVRLPGYAGGAGDTAAVVTFVQNNNPGTETGSATVDFPTTGGGFVGGAACPTP